MVEIDQINLYVAIGGNLPQTDFYPLAPKPLRIVKNALMTFPEYEC